MRLPRRRILQHAASPVPSASDAASHAGIPNRRYWPAWLRSSSGKKLFKTSLRYTLSHPLFGVGPDQFAAAVSQDAARAGPAHTLARHPQHLHANVQRMRHPRADLLRRRDRPLPALQPPALSPNSRSSRLARAGRTQPLSAGGHSGVCRERLFLPYGLQRLPPTLAGFTVALQLAVAPIAQK